jgi:hypothetical protein
MRTATLVSLVLLVGCASAPGQDPMIGSGVQSPASDNPTGTGGEFRLPADMVTASLWTCPPAPRTPGRLSRPSMRN